MVNMCHNSIEYQDIILKKSLLLWYNSMKRAFDVGTYIAKRHNSDIILLHVVNRFACLQPAEVFLPDIRLVPDLNLMLEDRIKEFVK